MPDPLIPPEAILRAALQQIVDMPCPMGAEGAPLSKAMRIAAGGLGDANAASNRAARRFPPEATIRVWTCDECHGHWFAEPRKRIGYFEGTRHERDGRDLCEGTVTERVYVDLAAVDREALVESYNEGGSPDLSELSDRDRRLLGDYNRWLGLGGDDA